MSSADRRPLHGPIRVDVRRTGRRFDAEAMLDLAADPQTVWDTITDYDALPRFMPGIRTCKVIERHKLAHGAERVVVEQQGEFRFLLFAQSMTVTVDIHQQPLERAAARATSFSLGLLGKRAIDIFEGTYTLGPVTGKGSAARVPLKYTAVIGLVVPPPPGIGALAVRQNLAAQLDAVALEVGRRSGRYEP